MKQNGRLEIKERTKIQAIMKQKLELQFSNETKENSLEEMREVKKKIKWC